MPTNPPFHQDDSSALGGLAGTHRGRRTKKTCFPCTLARDPPGPTISQENGTAPGTLESSIHLKNHRKHSSGRGQPSFGRAGWTRPAKPRFDLARANVPKRYLRTFPRLAFPGRARRGPLLPAWRAPCGAALRGAPPRGGPAPDSSKCNQAARSSGRAPGP